MSQITWDDGFHYVDGKCIKLGVIREEGKAPAQVQCDMDLAQALDDAGEPIDEAIKLVRLG